MTSMIESKEPRSASYVQKPSAHTPVNILFIMRNAYVHIAALTPVDAEDEAASVKRMIHIDGIIQQWTRTLGAAELAYMFNHKAAEGYADRFERHLLNFQIEFNKATFDTTIAALLRNIDWTIYTYLTVKALDAAQDRQDTRDTRGE